MNEALSMPSLDHSLWNPNQMRHHGVDVQDNPFSDEPMHISSSDGSLVACLQNEPSHNFDIITSMEPPKGIIPACFTI